MRWANTPLFDIINHETQPTRLVCFAHTLRVSPQEKLDMYAQYNQDFPPQSNRPRGALYITDRSMDLMAPFVHEFTYQAMAFDLLPIQDGEKVTFRTVVNEEEPGAEEKDMEISDKDKIWVENRHTHMKDTLQKLISDFQKFISDNPNFTNQDAQNVAGMNGPERYQRYACWLTAIPRNEGSILVASYYGAKMYGYFPETQVARFGYCGTGTINFLLVLITILTSAVSRNGPR